MDYGLTGPSQIRAVHFDTLCHALCIAYPNCAGGDIDGFAYNVPNIANLDGQSYTSLKNPRLHRLGPDRTDTNDVGDRELK